MNLDYNKVFRDQSGNQFPSNISKCAIVGNSGMLEDSDFGDFIDSHDCVIRFNAAPTDGYENDVGSKTTYRFLNMLMQRGRSLPHTTNTPDDFINGIRDENVILKYSGKGQQDRAEHILSPYNNVFKISYSEKHFYRKVLANFNIPNHGTNLGALSLGVRALLLFLPICDKINMLGFGFYKEDDLQKYHYWEDFTKHKVGPHRYDTEEGLVDIITEKCNVELH